MHKIIVPIFAIISFGGCASIFFGIYNFGGAAGFYFALSITVIMSLVAIGGIYGLIRPSRWWTNIDENFVEWGTDSKIKKTVKADDIGKVIVYTVSEEFSIRLLGKKGEIISILPNPSYSNLKPSKLLEYFSSMGYNCEHQKKVSIFSKPNKQQ